MYADVDQYCLLFRCLPRLVPDPYKHRTSSKRISIGHHYQSSGTNLTWQNSARLRHSKVKTKTSKYEATIMCNSLKTL